MEADPLAHIISLRVLDFEANRYAGDALMLACIERRRAVLSTLERRRRMHPDGGAAVAESSAGYAERLERAVAEEKLRAREVR